MNAQSRITLIVAAWCLLLRPVVGGAQTLSAGAIAGIVKDTSGAVLPGVTVEASSPALIEKTRTTVTDSQGLYRITELRPGTYTVTFTLTGFGTFRHEGIELTTGFTATVNADMAVGTVEETVTVSGATPIVDVSNVMQRQTFATETLDRLPTGRALGQYVSLIPAASGRLGDVDPAGGGGTSGEQGQAWGARGARWQDIVVLQDGMESNLTPTSANANNALSVNRAGVAEIAVQLGSNTAENPYGGVVVNAVPKTGSNTFRGEFETFYGSEHIAQNNVSDDLRARGLPDQPNVKLVYEISGAFGGPIKRDKLWFFTAHRRWVGQRYQSGNYWNATQESWFYTPDLSRPAHTDDIYQNHLGRVTWQTTPKQKFNISWDSQQSCACMSQLFEQVGSPEAHEVADWSPNEWGQATWNYTATNRLLFEAGALFAYTGNLAKPPEGVTPDTISVLELSTDYMYRSRARNPGANTAAHTERTDIQGNQRFSMSYVTGAHNVKTGLFLQQGTTTQDFSLIFGDGVGYEFRNGVPASLRQFVNEEHPINTGKSFGLGLYAQDQWRIQRLTLNLGGRFDYVTRWFPAHSIPAGRFVPERNAPETKGQPTWKDISPRVGIAYDLFGNGKTAVKFFGGRYVQRGLNAGRSALGQIVNNVRRTWTDSNGNFHPDCVLTNPQLNGECGVVSNLAFGQTIPSARDDEAILKGWGTRQSNWETTVSVQHEVRPGFGLEVGYFRRTFGDFFVTDNLLVTGADYDEYCLTAPVDPRLPDGGGYQFCGLYDIKPALVGRVDEMQTFASNFGKRTEVFNGVDVTMSLRFGRGGLLSGGISTGASVTDNCDVLANLDSPQRRFCRVTPPWSSNTNVKFSAVYPLPWGFETSVIFQNLPGIPITASYVARSAEAVPTLGRNLAAGANATVTVELIEPETMFEDRRTVFDTRFTRIFQVAGLRMQGNFDLFNLFNASPILAINTRYGPQWLQPRQILPGRMMKVGLQLDF